MPQDVRRKYIDRLEKLAKEALGQSPTSKYARKMGLPPRGPPKAAIFKSRADIGSEKFDPRALPMKPVLTSADLVELAGATRRNAERTGSRGGTGMSSRGGSRGGSRMGSRGSSRGGTAKRPGTSGSSSEKSRTIKPPANAALAGLNITGNEKPASARPSSADPRSKIPKSDAGLTPLEQLRRARKLIADMKKYNTTDHTWELLQTPGITKEE